MPWRPCKASREDWMEALCEAGTVGLMGCAAALAIILGLVLAGRL